MKKKFPRTNLIKRTSTLANAMVHSIVFTENLDTDYQSWLNRFDQTENEEICVYCGKKATSFDHVYNLVKEGLPTGYNTEKNNLVPCCGTCNSTKGSKNIEVFFATEYFKSYHGFKDRQRLLNDVIKKYPPIKLDLANILGSKFDRYKNIQKDLNQILKEYDAELLDLRNTIHSYVIENIK
jgi:hypothetical protein